MTAATVGRVSWPYPPPVAPPWGPDAAVGAVVLVALVATILLTLRDRANGRDGVYQILSGVGTALVWMGRVFFALAEGEDRLRRGVRSAASAAGCEVKAAYQNAVWVEKEAGRP